MIERIYLDIGPTDLTGERYVLVADATGRGWLVSDADREEGRSRFGHRLRRVEPAGALLGEAGDAPVPADGFAYVDEDPQRGGFALFVYGRVEEIPLGADETRAILFAGESALPPDEGPP